MAPSETASGTRPIVAAISKQSQELLKMTAWMGENHFVALPTAVYGIVLLLAAIAYYILAHPLIVLHGKTSALARALGKDFKNKLSVLLYAIAIPLAFAYSWAADALYVAVAIMWLAPDRRIEKNVAQ